MSFAGLNAQTVTPTGSIDWLNPAGWSTGHIPGGSETPQLSTGTITVTGSASIGSVNLFGGTLTNIGTGNGALTITGTGSEWRATSLSSSSGGTMFVTVNASADLLISTTNNHDFNRTGITNNGTVTWTAGTLRSGGGGSFTNAGTFNDNLATATDFSGAFGGGATFTNSLGATYTKTGNATTRFTAAAFNNSGAVTVQAGTLELNGGGTNSATGTFTTALNALTLFSNDYTLATGSALGGAGTYQFSAGTFTASGTVSVSKFNQTGGTLAGTQTFTNSAFNWSAGDWNSAGTTTLGTGTTLTLTGGDHNHDTRAIVNNGTVEWNAGRVRSGHGGSFTNNAVFHDNVTAATDYNADYGGGATFTNSLGATYTKTGNAVTRFLDVPFNNSGTVNVQAGTLQFNGGGTNSAAGVFSTSLNALTLFSNDYTIVNGSALGGAGAYQLSNGTFTVGGTVSVSTFNQTGGTLAGTQTFNNTAFNWSAGDWNSAGTTTLGTGTTLKLTGGDHNFDARAIINNGTVSWNAGRLRSGHGGSFTNNGTFNDNVVASTDFNADYGGGATFTNSLGATYTKTGNALTRFLDVPFNNSGTVNVQAGTLQFNGGGTNSGTGAFNTSAGALTLFSNDYTIVNGSALGGAGAYQLSDGTFTVGGTASVSTFNQTGGTLAGTQTFNSTAFNWSAGDWNSAGTTTLGTGTTLTLTGGDHNYDARAIINNGTVNWTAGRLRSGHGGSFTNNGAFNDNLTVATDYNADYGGGASFTNALGGTYTKTGNALTRFLDVPFNNSGTILVNAGTLQFNGGGTLSATGTMNVASGASVVFSNDYTLVSGSSLAGAGNFLATGGVFSVGGTVSVSNFQLAGAILAGTQTFNGTLTWNNGSLNDTGTTTTIARNATLTLATANNHDFDGHAIVNNGTVNWQAGAGVIRSGHGGTFTNNGVFIDADATSADFNNDYGGSSGTTFFNSAGAIYRKTGSGTTTLSIPVSNSGLLDVRAGILSLQTDSAFNAGTLQTGAGLLRFTAGTLTANGAMTFSHFQLTGGTVTGNHTFNGAIEWTAGNFNGGASTTTIGGTLTIDSANNHDFDAHTFVNNGIVNWIAGAIRSGDGATFTNNGAFNDTASNAFNNAYSGALATFTNASGGSYNKKAAGTTTFDVAFVNSGAVNVSAGTLNLDAGGSSTAGAKFNAASGATLAFTGGTFTVASGASFSGVGTFGLSGGTLSLSGGIAAPNFSLTGGTLAGTQTFGGNLNWVAGNFNDSGTTTTIGSTASLTISSANNHDFDAHALVNNGTVNWTGGTLRSGDAGTFTNNSLFIDAASNSITNAYNGTALLFTNSAGATYRKTAAGTTTISVPFVNSGTLDLQAGTLALASSSTFNAGTTQTGAGLLQLSGGTLTANGTSTFTNFQIAGGTITGNHTFNGAIEWTAGDFNGSASTTTIGGILTIDSANNHDFNTHAFVNTGIVNWTAGAIRSGNGGTFTNSGVFNDTASGAVNNAYNGTLATFTNAAGASYNKSAAGTTTFDVAFANSGAVNVGAGTLNLDAGGSSTAGAKFTVLPGTTLGFTGGTFTAASGTNFAGAGTVAVTGGTLSLSGNVAAPNFSLTGGTVAGTQTFLGNVTWTAGNFNDTATTTTIGSAATLNVSSGNNHDFDAHNLVNNGTVNWSAGAIRSGNAGTFINNGAFNDTASTAFNNGYNGTLATFANASGGAYNKNAAGTTTFSIPFTNAGTLNVNAGTLSFTSTFSNSATGAIIASNGASLSFANALNVGTGKLGGTGTITASTVTAGGLIAPGNSAGLLAIVGNLTLLATATSQFEIGGTTRGTNYDGLNVSGTATLAGTLAPTFLNAAYATTLNSDTFTLLNAGTLAGAFGNVASGNRLATADGTGSFLVTTNGTTLTLSQFALDAATRLWAGGDLNTNGNVTPSLLASSTVPAGSHLAIYTNADHDFNGTAFVNNGTVDWAGGNLRSGNSGSIANAGTWNDSASFDFNNAFGGTSAVFNNTGTYNKTAGTTTMSVPFNNAGTVTASGGTLSLNAGGTISAGANYNGAGQTLLNSGTFTASGLFTSTNLVLGGTATLAGNTSLGGAFTWTSGNFNEGSTTTIPLGATLNAGTTSTGFHDFNFHALINNGTFNWSAGLLRSGNSGTFTNNAVFNDTADSIINNAYGGTSFVFTNAAAGTYNKIGPGTTAVSVPFNNAGTVTAATGTLSLDAGGTISAGANYNGAGQTLLNSGTFTASGLFTSTNLVLGGTATLAGNTSLGGTFTWTSGNFNEGSTTTIPLGATLNAGATSTGFHDFNFHALINNGTFNWSAGLLRSGNSGTFTNNAIFNDTADSIINNAYGGTSFVFTNAAAGTYNKTGPGTTNVNAPFNNAGTVTVTGGTLLLNAGGTISAGANFAGVGQTLLNAGTYTASGLFTSTNLILGGTATLAGNTSLGGTFTWTSGTFNTGDTTTIPAGATLNAIATSTGLHDFNFHALINNGTFNWSAGLLRSGNSGTFTNNAVFNDTADSTINNAYGGTSFVFTNAAAGTYNKSGPGTTNVSAPFNNAGTVNVTGGTLLLNAGGTIGAGANFTGAGVTQLAAGTFTGAGSFSTTNLILAGATFAGTSAFNGLFTWSSGLLAAGAFTTVNSGGTLELTTTANHDLPGSSLINDGIVNWAAGDIRSGNSGSILNAGTWNDAASANISNAFGGTTATFSNTGVYLKTLAGTTVVSLPFTNSGLVHVTGGTLQFSSSFTQTAGTIAVATNSTLQFDNGLNLAAGFLYGNGGGSIAGNVSSSGTISPSFANAPRATGTTGILGLTGNLSLQSVSVLFFELGGTNPGTGYDQLAVSGSTALGGALLNVSFVNGFQTTVTSGNTFTVLTANSLSGAFNNAANGARLFTLDGAGSFLVNYGAASSFDVNSVVLSQFVPVPEPATWSLLLAGLGAFAFVARRKK